MTHPTDASAHRPSTEPAAASPRPRRAVVLAAGSAGDVVPLAGIAAALSRRGIDTTLMAPGRYRPLSPAGVAFRSLGADEVFDAVFDGSRLWTARHGLSESWRYYGAAALSGYRQLADGWSPSDTALVSSSFAVAARLAEDALGFANTTVHLSPAVLYSRRDPPRWPAFSIPHGWPTWAKAAAAATAERVAIDPVIRRALRAALEVAHVVPGRGMFSHFIHSPRRVAYLFPRWFAEAAADWPAVGRHVGFPQFVPPQAGLSPDLRRFVTQSAGSLAVVTAGTSVSGRPAWVEHAVVALRQAGARVLVLAPGHSVPGRSDDDRLWVASWVNLREVLPHARLIVHHGGIGTAIEALRARTPQWLFPGAHDQPDNAERLRRLGVARVFDTRASTAVLHGSWNDAWPADTARRLDDLHGEIATATDGTQQVADWVVGDPTPSAAVAPASRTRAS